MEKNKKAGLYSITYSKQENNCPNNGGNLYTLSTRGNHITGYHSIVEVVLLKIKTCRACISLVLSGFQNFNSFKDSLFDYINLGFVT